MHSNALGIQATETLCISEAKAEGMGSRFVSNHGSWLAGH